MTIPCQICEKPSHGNHYGAISCRACAAFFRRSIRLNYASRKCVIGANNCDIEDGSYFCKKCKVSKCFQVGMTSDKLQNDRGPISVSPDKQLIRAKKLQYRKDLQYPINHNSLDISPYPSIPVSMTTFLGRPTCVLFCEPGRSPIQKCFIDFSDMIDKGSRQLFEGCPTPLYFEKSNLKKLTNCVAKQMEKPKLGKLNIMYGKNLFCNTISNSFTATAEFLNNFSDFQHLERFQKLEILKTIWHLYSRYKSVFSTARRQMNSENFLKSGYDFLGPPEIAFNWDYKQFDFSWVSDCTNEQLSFFFTDEIKSYQKVLKLVTELNPNDTELTFMISQFCLHYAGKRLQGEVGDICDRLQDIISNELHNYYVNDMNISNYSTRLAKMMKINNLIQLIIIKNRSKIEIAKLFNVFKVGYSHPELLEDF